MMLCVISYWVLSGATRRQIQQLRCCVLPIKLLKRRDVYGLHHVTNIWHGTKLGFNADDPYFASIIGKTVTQITFDAADGVYVLPVNVAL